MHIVDVLICLKVRFQLLFQVEQRVVKNRNKRVAIIISTGIRQISNVENSTGKKKLQNMFILSATV